MENNNNKNIKQTWFKYYMLRYDTQIDHFPTHTHTHTHTLERERERERDGLCVNM